MPIDSIAKRKNAATRADSFGGVRYSSADAGDRPDIRQTVRRHCEHLESLATNLRKFGMDEWLISERVLELFGTYVRTLVGHMESVGDSKLPSNGRPTDTNGSTEQPRV